MSEDGIQAFTVVYLALLSTIDITLSPINITFLHVYYYMYFRWLILSED